MRRKIKYRAWETISKSMMSWKQLLPHLSDILKATKQRNVILMQFTGRRDKANNKEIYEEDIVKHQNGFLYVVRWSDVNSWWYLEQVRGKDTPYTGGINGQDLWRCKVLGNVYENSELLK